MSLHDLMRELHQLKVRLWVDGGELRFSAPRNTVDEQMRARIRGNKQALIDLLSRGEDDGSDADDDGVDYARELSFAQQRLLFLHRMDSESPAYHLPYALRLRGPLDVEALQYALNASMRRHDALRTCFQLEDGEYVRGRDAAASLNLRPISLRDTEAATREEALTALIDEEARTVFDLSQAPLMRAVLVDIADDDHALLLTMHHVISDGWSIELLGRELWAAYSAVRGGAPLTDGSVLGSDAYVRWQRRWLRSADFARQKDYWVRQLTGVPELTELPLDYPRPAVHRFEGAVERFDLPAPLLRKLEAVATDAGCSLYMVLMSALFALLHRYTGQEDLAIGTPVANRRRRDWENAIGFFSNVVVMRLPVAAATPFRALLETARETSLSAFEHQEFPFEQVVEHLQQKRSLSYSPLFQVMFILKDAAADQAPDGLRVSELGPDLGVAKFDLTLTVQKMDDGASAGFEYATALFKPATVRRMAGHYLHLLAGIAEDPKRAVGRIDLVGDEERDLLRLGWNRTDAEYPTDACIHTLIQAQAARTPDMVAVSYEQEDLTYAELLRRADALATVLRAQGIGPEHKVGVYIERSLELAVALLGILMADAAYVPLDPGYPADRIAWIAGDAELSAIVSCEALRQRVPECGSVVLTIESAIAAVDDTAMYTPAPHAAAHAENIAYVIYTSGSTGKPKGVMVTHGNAVNLFDGLDRSLAPTLGCHAGDERPVWMALTSISFDISVLELLWTLTRGHHVILQKDHLTALSLASVAADATPVEAPMVTRRSDGTVKPAPDFSLFYFASDEDSLTDKYRLLLDGARFADDNGFSAVWIPERHFHAFGGQFPNPSVAAAAVAAITRRIQIRAGSCVLPLHDPIRIAEEWSMVDNLSGGRAAVAFASGWHFNDFILAPDHFQDRHQVLRDGIDTVRTLWRGDTIRRRDGLGNEVDVRVRPRPVQDALPIWITAAASPDTFRYAGEIGANVLTHLLGQSLPELKEKIELYRRARSEHGHDPDAGKVTLMLHTFVGEDPDTVRATVREPFKNYLRSSINLLKPVAESQGLDAGNDLELVVEAGFNRYFASSALFGTPESCREMIARVSAIGVDEIGCLIDFGVDPQQVIDNFGHLGRLRALIAEAPAAAHADENAGSGAPLVTIRDSATHVQCTPSFARLMLEQKGAANMLRNIRGFLVGGEALSSALARDLKAAIGGELFNMYGPTETTVWSAVRHIVADEANIGAPISNTRLYVLDTEGGLSPLGVKGELYISGDGVTRGYWKRPDLTAERFLPDPFADRPGARMFRTGDLVRRLDDGTIEFIARIDNQVKVRGYRVELGEIESALLEHEAVKDTVAIVRSDEPHTAAIFAYVVLKPGMIASVESLQARLATSLPDYMRPSAIIELAVLPLTPNGKIDRNALPAASAVARSTASRDMPRNEVEVTLSSIWCNLLDIDSVGINDNFFELGGHSLLLGKLQQRISDAFGHEVGIIELFKYPTISSLAAMIGCEDKVPRFRKAAQRSRDGQDAVTKMRERMKRRKQHGTEQHEPS